MLSAEMDFLTKSDQTTCFGGVWEPVLPYVDFCINTAERCRKSPNLFLPFSHMDAMTVTIVKDRRTYWSVSIVSSEFPFEKRRIVPGDFDEEKQKDDGKEESAPTTELLEAMYPNIFYTNARNVEGTKDVLKYLTHCLATPCKVWAVEPGPGGDGGGGAVTNLSPVERIEELIREKEYRVLHQEVPHAVSHLHNGIFDKAKLKYSTKRRVLNWQDK